MLVVLLNNKACYLIYFSRPIDLLGGRHAAFMVNALILKLSSPSRKPRPETFHARNAIVSSSVFKNGEV